MTNPYGNGVADPYNADSLEELPTWHGGRDDSSFFDARRFTCGILEVLCVVWMGWATLAYWNGWDVLPLR